MKILHLIDTLNLGGAQTVLKGIVEQSHALNAQYEHIIYVLRQTENTKNIDHNPIYIHPSSKKYSLRPLQTLKQIIKEENITVLHCHLFRSIVFGCLLKRFFFPNMKLVVHEHGEIFRSGKIYPYILNIFHTSIDGVISVSQSTSDQLTHKTRINLDKIHLLYNFVNLDHFSRQNLLQNKKSLREKYNIPSNKFVVGFGGRLINMKGWKEFIRAAQYITSKNLNIDFIIAGDGSEKEEMLSLIQESAQIHYVGYISDMPSFYAMLDCFVVASHWESMGLTAIEAQAMKVPVISSDVPALNEIVNDYKDGLLFQVQSVESLTEKIDMLYNDTDLQNTLIANGEKNATKYSLDNYIQQLYKVYNAI